MTDGFKGIARIARDFENAAKPSQEFSDAARSVRSFSELSKHVAQFEHVFNTLSGLPLVGPAIECREDDSKDKKLKAMFLAFSDYVGVSEDDFSKMTTEEMLSAFDRKFGKAFRLGQTSSHVPDWSEPLGAREVKELLKGVDSRMARFAKKNSDWFKRHGKRKWIIDWNHPEAQKYIRK